MAYTYKIVNGTKIALSSEDQTVLAARDAAYWVPGPPPVTASTMTAAEKAGRLAQSLGLTLAELKAEINRS